MSRRAKGEGSVHWDAARGRYVGQADAGINPKTGKRRRVKVVGRPDESKASVAKRVQAKIAELDGSSGGPKTVGDLVEKWMAKGMPGGKPKSPTTVAGLRSHARSHVLPVFGSQPLGSVTADDIEDFLEARVATLSKSTLIKLKTILKQSYDFGVARRYVAWNPARVALLPADAEQKRYPRALLPAERRALINVSSDHRLGAWVVVTSTLALRPGEVYGLCWDAVDLDAGTLTVRRTMLRDGTLKDGTKTGTSGIRTLRMPGETIDALRGHRKALSEERLLVGDRWPDRWKDLVFVSEAGTPLTDSNMRRLVTRWAREAKVIEVDKDGNDLSAVTPYDLRHTALTRLREMGATRDQLVDIAGHLTTRMIDLHYVHRDQLTVDAAADLWNKHAG
jgi:integrase